MSDTSWQDRAACVGLDPETWFDTARAAEAKTICMGCPVIEACAEHRRNTGSAFGVWGGFVGKMRITALGPSAGRVLIKHGTNAGYSTHLRHNIPPCHACREAHRQYGVQANERRRVTA